MGHLRPHPERIVYDVIDGQVLIIRSDTGSYYSLVGSAADVWRGLMAGLDDDPAKGRHEGDDGEKDRTSQKREAEEGRNPTELSCLDLHAVNTAQRTAGPNQQERPEEERDPAPGGKDDLEPGEVFRQFQASGRRLH